MKKDTGIKGMVLWLALPAECMRNLERPAGLPGRVLVVDSTSVLLTLTLALRHSPMSLY